MLIKVDRQKNKADPPFDPKPLVVTNRNGFLVTAERNRKIVTRNSSFFKPSPKHPEEVLSDEEGEDLIELVLEPQPNAPVQAPTEAPIEAPQQQTPQHQQHIEDPKGNEESQQN